jgi:hypothetical protein
MYDNRMEIIPLVEKQLLISNYYLAFDYFSDNYVNGSRRKWHWKVYIYKIKCNW